MSHEGENELTPAANKNDIALPTRTNKGVRGDAAQSMQTDHCPGVSAAAATASRGTTS